MNTSELLYNLTEHITDDKLIQAVSEYLDLSIPAQQIRADKRLLNAIFVNPLIEDCYTSYRPQTKHRKDCVISLVYSTYTGNTEPYRSV